MNPKEKEKMVMDYNSIFSMFTKANIALGKAMQEQENKKAGDGNGKAN